MKGYIIRRLLWLAFVLLAISVITFGLMHAVPGGPWDEEKFKSVKDPQRLEWLNEQYGLDEPLWRQYGDYLWNTLHGDLGPSYEDKRDVTDILLDGFPPTLTLAVAAFAIAIILGIPLGVIAALRQNTRIDYACTLLATLLVSIPSFVIGIILMILFGVILDLLPVAGWGSPGYLAGLRSPEYVILPALALSAFPTALIARITQASVLDTLRQDYVRTARAKGLPERTIVTRHVLRNAMIPILTISGPQWALLISGSVIVENLFSVPGIGGLFVNGVLKSDYGLIMGGTLFYAFAITLTNLVVDILYTTVDPRIRLEQKTS